MPRLDEFMKQYGHGSAAQGAPARQDSAQAKAGKIPTGLDSFMQQYGSPAPKPVTAAPAAAAQITPPAAPAVSYAAPLMPAEQQRAEQFAETKRREGEAAAESGFSLDGWIAGLTGEKDREKAEEKTPAEPFMPLSDSWRLWNLDEPERAEKDGPPKEDDREQAEEDKRRAELEERHKALTAELDEIEANAGYITDPDAANAAQKRKSEIITELYGIDAELGSPARFYDEASRLGATLTGAAQELGAGYLTAVGLALSLAGAQDETGRAIADSAYAGYATDPLSEAIMRAAVEQGAAPGSIGVLEENERLAEGLYGAADKLAEESAVNLGRAKEGLTGFDALAVDLTKGAADLAGDALASLIAPGSGMAAMATRIFGNAAAEVRRDGGSVDKQLLAGLKAAGIEVLTEKIAGPFEKIYGRSFTGRAISRALDSLDNPVIAKALSMASDALGEGAEEILSDVLNPIADRLLKLDDGTGSIFKDTTLSQVLYDGLVGAILGMFGSAVKVEGGAVTGETIAEAEQQAVSAATQAMDRAAQPASGALQETDRQEQMTEPAQILADQAAPKNETPAPAPGRNVEEQRAAIEEEGKAEAEKSPADLLAETAAGQQSAEPSQTNIDNAAANGYTEANETNLPEVENDGTGRGIEEDRGGVPGVYEGRDSDHPGQGRPDGALADSGSKLLSPESQNSLKQSGVNAETQASTDNAAFSAGLDEAQARTPTASAESDAETAPERPRYTLLSGEQEQSAAIEDAYDKVVGEGHSVEIPPEVLNNYRTPSGGPIQDLVSAVKAYYNAALKGTKVDVRMNGGVLEIKFENDGKKKSVGWRMKADKAATFERLHQLFESAEYAYSEENRDAKERADVPVFHYFVANAIIDGKNIPVKLQTRDLNLHGGTETRYYTHTLQGNEKGSHSPGTVTQAGESGHGNAYAPTTSIAQDGAAVNAEGVETETAQNMASELADEREGIPAPGTISEKFNTASGEFNAARNAEAETQGAEERAVEDAGPYEEAEGEKPRGKLSQFWTNTLRKMEAAKGAPPDVSQPLFYLPISEAESLARAASALAEDEQGTVEKLVNATAWDGVQNDSAQMIADKLFRDAKKSNDWSAYKAWRKVMREHVTATAQGLQANAKYTRHTGEAAVDRAVEAGAPNGTVSQIAQFAEELDSIESGDRAGLIDLILRLADRRGNRTIIKGNLERSLNKQSEEWLREAAYLQLEGITRDALNRGMQNMANKVASYRVLAMLSGLPTMGRNIEGNTTFGVIDLFSASGPGRAIDALVGAATGQRLVVGSRGPIWQTAPEWFKNAASAMEQSMVETALDISTDTRSRPMEMTANSAFVADSNLVERMFQRWSQIMSYALTSTDRFYRGGIETGERENYAAFDEKRAAKGKKGTGLSAEEQAAAAERTADYRLFQNQSMISEWAKENRRRLNNMLGFGGKVDENGKRVSDNTFGIGSLAMPFIEVPTNLALKSVEYGPANLAKGMYELTQLFKAVHQNNISTGEKISTAAMQQKAVMDTARGLTGTGLLILATSLARAGLIRNGDDEDDYNVAAVNNLTGQSGTQINLSAIERALTGGGTEWRDGDIVIGMAGISPLDLWMNAGTKLAALDADAGFRDKSEAYFQGVVSSVLDIPMFSTMAEMTNTLRDAESITWDTAAELGGEMIDSWASGFIPQFVKQGARAADDYQRDTAGDTWLEDRGNTISQYLPFLREKLPEKVDSFGNPKEQADEALRWINGLISPNSINEIKSNPVIDMLAGLHESTGSSNFYPNRKAPGSIGTGEDKIELTAEQKRDYQEAQGQAYMDGVSALMEAAGWGELTDEQKAAAIGKVKTESKHEAEAALYEAMGLDREPDTDNWEELDDEQRALYLVAKAGSSELYDKDGNITDYDAMDAYLRSDAFRALDSDTVAVLATGKLSRVDDMAEAARQGIGSEQYDTALKKWRELGGSDQSSTEAAEALKTFIAGMPGLNAKQKEWLGTKIRFWQHIPVDTATMDKLTAGDVSADSAAQLAQSFRAISPATGYKTVQYSQKYQAIASASYLSNSEKWNALFALENSENKKAMEEARLARSRGYTYDEWAEKSEYCKVKTK